MKNFAFDRWDHGRLLINHDYAALFEAARWTTFEAVWQATSQAAIAKDAGTERVTCRFELTGSNGPQAFYIKRHVTATLYETMKPLLHGRLPCLGAKVEWDALLAFHEAGLATMMPVALGQGGSESFLITAELTGCTKLSECPTDEQAQSVVPIAEVARKMHRARLHHQDFYLGHLLRPHDPGQPIHVIDLGRVQKHGPWFARRWIVKDLAQLNYSAKTARATDRLRFWQAYQGRPLSDGDKPLIRRILSKTKRIARHSQKNGL
ncbi:MAG TPA: lipopolysaccharide kinase InaA family protein [Planctomycetaceae bacterium]|nr:lipopolysaccharide kinase InaA family protein [Planctomycetaceae bacterium]